MNRLAGGIAMRHYCFNVFCLMLIVGVETRADVLVRFDPPVSTVLLGNTVHVNLVADFSDAILGWGLDLDNSDTFVAAKASVPTIASPWTAAFTADGDGLGAVAFPTPVSGSGIVLAGLTFQANEIGVSQLSVHATHDDFTEGFALYPTGFASFVSDIGIIQVIPEPGSATLLVVAAMVACRRR